MSAVDRVLDALGAADTRESGGQFMVRCPAHEDRRPSLAVRPVEGRALLCCHAGCEVQAVVDAAKLTMADLFDEPRGVSYRYDDGRVVNRSPDKRFRQSGNLTGRPQLYRLERIRAAVSAGETVYVVEGEQDVHTLESDGQTATTSPMGSTSWRKVDPEPLRGAHVVVVADNDEAGMKYAADVAGSLNGLAASVKVVRAAAGKDVTDHLLAGHSLQDLVPVQVVEQVAAVEHERRRIHLVPASTVRLDRPRWLWDTAPPGSTGPQSEGRIPVGMLTIGAGPAGIGKSQHCAWLAANLTRGTLAGHYAGTPRSVIYAAAEDSWSMTIAPRLLAAGADLERVFRVDVEDAEDPHARLTLPRDTLGLEDAIGAHNVALIVMDPLLSLVDAQVNDYRAREVRAALEPLVDVADRTGCAMFGLAHFTKASGTDPLLLISGSGAFGQVIRAGIGYARDEEAGGYVLSTIKSNLGREDLPSLAYTIKAAAVPTDNGEAWVSRLLFRGTAERSVRDLLRESTKTEDERDDRNAADRWLTGYFAEHGETVAAADATEAAAAAGLSKTTLTRARNRAGVTTSKSGLHDGWVWSRTSRRDHEETEGSTPENVGSSVPSVDSSEPADDSWAAQEPPIDDFWADQEPPDEDLELATAAVLADFPDARPLTEGDHRTEQQREDDRRRDAVFGRRSA